MASAAVTSGHFPCFQILLFLPIVLHRVWHRKPKAHLGAVPRVFFPFQTLQGGAKWEEVGHNSLPSCNSANWNLWVSIHMKGPPTKSLWIHLECWINLENKGKKQLGFSPARDHDILPSPVTPFKFSSPPTWVPPSNLTTGKVGMVASLSCCEGHDSLKRGCTLRSLDHHTSLQRASETSGKGCSLRGVFSVLGKHEPWTLRLKDQGSNSSSAGNTFFDCCLSK